MMTGAFTPRRRGGSTERRVARRSPQIDAVPYITRQIPLYDVLGEEGLQIIENNAETILEEIGVEFRGDPEALDLWKQAGADIDGERVRMPRGLARALVKTAPREFVQHARNPERNVIIGGNHLVLAPGYGSPFVTDIDRGRRYATIEDFRNLVKLTAMTPYLHHSGGTVCEPMDIPEDRRHLDMVYSHIRYSDKAFMGSVTSAARAEDSVHMAKLVFGDEFVERNVVLLNLINSNSPLVFDETMLGALKVYARHNQANLITPSIMQGAMSPVSDAGTLAQVLAEALAGIAFTQLVRPGSPVVFGSDVGPISMQTGAPMGNSAQGHRVLFAAGQLVRRLGLPFRGAGSNSASLIADAQVGYEGFGGLMSGTLAGVNFLLHAAGMLESGLTMSYEKFIMDIDQCALVHGLAQTIDLSENGQAMDAIREVGPGGHYLACGHTLLNVETVFHHSPIATTDSFEQWQAEGSLDTAQRANRIWKNMLKSYEPPPIDPAIDEALGAFMTERKESLSRAPTQ
jgi:trimethylamine--corrinoid protein Co-methyltransferase